jgi:hypothetical protein
VRSNPNGYTDIRAINIETAGDDQVTTMRNNGSFGFGTALADRLYQVESATKTYGDTDWGSGDLTGVNPNFVDHNRSLAAWQNTQNGGGDAEDAIDFALRINGYDSVAEDQGGTLSGFLVTNLIDWVMGGFAPTASEYEASAHDGGTMGAVAFVSSGSGGGSSVIKLEFMGIFEDY